MKVRYAPRAEERFLDELALLYALNPFAADRLFEKVERALRRLRTFPRSGPRIPEFSDKPFREFIVEPYRFFYFIDDRAQTVWIVDVWHGAQIPAEPRPPAASVLTRT